MSQLQSSSGIMRALRGAVQQAHAGVAASGWWARPPGSLITSQPSTSSGDACQASHVRGMSRLPTFTNPFAQMFDYRKFVYPDVYDPQEALICQRYKSHGMLIERAEPVGQLTHFNPLALKNPLGDPELERKTKYFWSRFYTRILCYRSVWNFSKPALQARILAAYRVVNEALASGNLKAAEPFVSEQMMQRLAGEVARRGRQVEVKWELVDPAPEPSSVQLVLGASAKNPLKQGRLHFVQWTARIVSRQRVAVYDSKGRLIAGDPDKVLDVVDYWVFERPILKGIMNPRPGPQGADWRLVERL